MTSAPTQARLSRIKDYIGLYLNKKGQSKKIILLHSYSVLLPEKFFLGN